MFRRQHDWLKRFFTRTIFLTVKGKKHSVKLEPSQRLILYLQFAVAAFFGLVALQISALVFLHVWSGEVFATITGLLGTVTGILIYHDALGV
jgi:hypothetical protein